jgi:hypothetical protein
MNRIYCFLLLICTMLLASCHENFDDRCVRESKEFTAKQCPQTVDPNGVKMDSMTYDKPTHTMRYYFKLFGKMDDSTLVAMATPKFHAGLIDNVRNSLEIKSYKDKGIQFEYIYFSTKTGRKMLDLTVGPSEYK